MYDRKTETYWTQIGGRAIVGELTGAELEPISVQTVFWGDWKSLYPDAEVLSRETGYDRPYGVDPYGNYYSSEGLMFPVEDTDDRLHAKAVVYGIEVNGAHKAYPEDEVLSGDGFTDSVGGVEIEIRVDENDAVTIVRTDTGERIVFERDFWFAWYAFYPETKLYGSDES